jgi:hypothetical protein
MVDSFERSRAKKQRGEEQRSTGMPCGPGPSQDLRMHRIGRRHEAFLNRRAIITAATVRSKTDQCLLQPTRRPTSEAAGNEFATKALVDLQRASCTLSTSTAAVESLQDSRRPPEI